MIHEQSATSFHSSERAFSEAKGSVSGTVDRTDISFGAPGRSADDFSLEASQDFTKGMSEDDERKASIRSTKSPAWTRLDTEYESAASASDPETRELSGGSGHKSAIFRKRSKDPR